MKRNNIKIILILLFSCFIVLPLFLKLVGYSNFEGLANKKNEKMNDCSGTDLSNCVIDKKSDKCSEPEPIKCIADFGTSIGDPLCCGQDGVLQDTRYVCPSNLTKCSNFKCGSAFGTCVKGS